MLRLYHHLLLLHLFLLQFILAAPSLSLKLNNVVPLVKETQLRISDTPEITTHHHNGGKLREGVAPQGVEEKGNNYDGNSGTAKPPEYSNGRPMFKYYSGDHEGSRSEIGGEVIIGGLVTVALGVVFFYIRVTRRSTTTGIVVDQH